MTSTPNPTPTPTWYDVLGVAHDATPAEIKAAWRHATDRFEPGSGSGQFRMFNDAADVLLDPERRRAYDATLGEHEPRREEAAVPTAPPAVDEAEGEHAVLAPEEPPVRRRARRQSAKETEDTPPRSGLGAALVASLGAMRTATLAVLAVLTAGVLVACVLVGIKLHQQAAVADARIEAPPAAEQAVKALFSYDYRDLDAERKRAGNYMTPSFAKTYLANFDALKQQKDGAPGLAVQTKAVVSASVQGSGVVDAESDVARVLVFVNLVSRKGTGSPQIFQNRVAVTMQKDGGRWLVSNVNSY